MQHFQPTPGFLIGPVSFRAPLARDLQCNVVLQLVAKALNVRKRLLVHPSRCMADTALARQTAMYLLHVVLGWAMADVGAVFGRDRTTVSYACAKVEDRRDDPAFEAKLNRLEQRILDLIGEDDDVAF